MVQLLVKAERIKWTIGGAIVVMLGLITMVILSTNVSQNETLVTAIVTLVGTSVPALIAAGKAETAAKDSKATVTKLEDNSE